MPTTTERPQDPLGLPDREGAAPRPPGGPAPVSARTLLGIPTPMSSTRFRWWLAGIAVLAVAVRLAFALAVADDLPPAVDAGRYRDIAQQIAGGDGWAATNPQTDATEPTAALPPGFPAVLAVLDVVGLDSADAQRAALSVIAVGGIVFVGLLGRRLVSERAGLLAAALAAVHPLWYQAPGLGISEALYLVLVPATLLAAVRVIDQRTYLAAALLGLSIGATALVRTEAILLLALLAVPTTLVSGRGWRARIRVLAAIALATAVVVGPWVVRNQIRLGSPVLATNGGVALAGGWCDTTFAGPTRGSYDDTCAKQALRDAFDEAGEQIPDEVSLDGDLIQAARDYAGDHPGSTLGTMAARIARTAGVGYTADQLEFDEAEGHDPGSQRVGQALEWVLLTLAAAGILLGSARRWRRWFPLLAGPAVAVVTAAVFYGSTRMRAVAEPAVVVLAAAGAVQLVRRYTGRGTTDLEGPSDEDGTAIEPSRASRWVRRRTRRLRWMFRTSL